MLTDEQFTRAVEQYADMVYRIALNYLKTPPRQPSASPGKTHSTAKTPAHLPGARAFLILLSR